MRTPNNAWRYKHPVTGMLFSDILYSSLLKKVRLHHQSNNLPFSETEFEDTLCQQINDKSVCADGTKDSPAPASKRTTIEEAAAFIRVAGEWMKGREFVPQEEAERRAAICAACPENVKVEGCSACRNLVGRLTQLLGRRKTSLDSKLQGCRVCGCSNVAQVHIPLDALAKGVKPDMEFPQTCWKK